MTAFDQVELPDGRRIDVRTSGPDDGFPLVFHHGTPGAGIATRALERAAHGRNLRVVAISRPGYGGSTRLAGRSVADVVPDIAAVLDTLGHERCVVAGWSGGGPHALACAARLPSASAALVIAGVAPYDAGGLEWMAGMGEENIVEFSTALDGAPALRGYLEGQRSHLADATVKDIVSSLATILPDVDRDVLTNEFGQDMVASFHEALRTGVEGWLDDDLAFVTPWGFGLDEIEIPTMFWQGSADLMVPFAHGKWLSSQVPGASAHLEEGEGHLSVAIGAMDRMLDELAEAGAR